MTKITNKLSKKQQTVFTLFFLSFIAVELIDWIKWGYFNAFELHIFFPALIMIIAVLFNIKYVKIPIYLILWMLIYLLLFKHSPAYSPYQIMTFVCSSLGIRSIEFQKYIHAILYFVLFLYLLISTVRNSKG